METASVREPERESFIERETRGEEACAPAFVRAESQPLQ